VTEIFTPSRRRLSFVRYLSAIRPILTLMGLWIAVFPVLTILSRDYRQMPIEEPPRTEYLPHVIEAGKAYADIVSMLTTLGTGLFVLVALVARRSLLPSIRVAAADAFVLALFAVSMILSFYMALQARYAIAEGVLFHQLNTIIIIHVIGLEAWFTLSGGLCAGALVAEALLTYRRSNEG
jgi:hypothetical protein